jgi:hypothetical protein
LNTVDIGLDGLKWGLFAQKDMLEGSGVENHINSLHFVTQPVSVAHIGQKKGCLLVAGIFMFDVKKLAFIIVKGDKLCDLVYFQKLADQLSSDGSAGSGDQDALFS